MAESKSAREPKFHVGQRVTSVLYRSDTEPGTVLDVRMLKLYGSNQLWPNYSIQFDRLSLPMSCWEDDLSLVSVGEGSTR